MAPAKRKKKATIVPASAAAAEAKSPAVKNGVGVGKKASAKAANGTEAAANGGGAAAAAADWKDPKFKIKKVRSVDKHGNLVQCNCCCYFRFFHEYITQCSFYFQVTIAHCTS